MIRIGVVDRVINSPDHTKRTATSRLTTCLHPREVDIIKNDVAVFRHDKNRSAAFEKFIHCCDLDFIKTRRAIEVTNIDRAWIKKNGSRIPGDSIRCN